MKYDIVRHKPCLRANVYYMITTVSGHCAYHYYYLLRGLLIGTKYVYM